MLLRRLAKRTTLREDLRLLDDESFVGELRPITFTVTGTGAVEVDPGWFYCNGFAISRATYKRLFDEIGTTYGVGDGSTTFNLPDFRGRSPLPHADGQSGATRVAGAVSGNATVPGAVGGVDTVVLTKAQLPAHVHNSGSFSVGSGGSHGHGYGTLGLVTSNGGGGTDVVTANTTSISVNIPLYGNFDAASHSHASSDFGGSTDSGAGLSAGSHNNAPPHLPINGMVIRS